MNFSAKSSHFPQIDALRAFAMLAVLAFHWLPESMRILPWGGIGVTLFFIISGFLITRILLIDKEAYLSQKATLGKLYKNFVVRRGLRIFPLYYAFITFILLAYPNNSFIDERPWFYYGYFYNFDLANTHEWSDILSPFWSLSVEEQFYLFWPLCIFLMPHKWTPHFIILTMASAFVSRAILNPLPLENGILTSSCVDSFAMGGLWAFIGIYKANYVKQFTKIVTWATPVCLAIFLYIVLSGNKGLWANVFYRFLMSVPLLLLLIQATKSEKNKILSPILDNVFIKFIGRISYGMYVFHMVVPEKLFPFCMGLINRFLSITIHSTIIPIFLNFALLVVVSTLSFYCFEKPITNLKKHFN